MPESGSRNKPMAPARLRRFALCFNDHRPDGKVWSVRLRGTWHQAAHVVIEGTLETVYRGATAAQPRALLQGTYQSASITPRQIRIRA